MGKQAAAAAERSLTASAAAQVAASSAGIAGQQAVVRGLHLANAASGPAPSPFSPGIPGPDATGLGAFMHFGNDSSAEASAEAADNATVDTASASCMPEPSLLTLGPATLSPERKGSLARMR